MSTLNVDALVGNTSANAITVRGEGTATTSLQQGLAKSFLAYKGISTNAIYDSNNIASVTDVATGKQTPNFTNNFNSANNYATTGFGQAHDTDTNGGVVHTGVNSGNTIVFEEDGAFTQPVVHVMGDLA